MNTVAETIFGFFFFVVRVGGINEVMQLLISICCETQLNFKPFLKQYRFMYASYLEYKNYFADLIFSFYIFDDVI